MYGVKLSVGTVVDGKTDADLLKIVNDNFDFRPGCLMRDLQLARPIYLASAAYSHFGRTDKDFTWEHPKVFLI